MILLKVQFLTQRDTVEYYQILSRYEKNGKTIVLPGFNEIQIHCDPEDESEIKDIIDCAVLRGEATLYRDAINV